MWPHRRQPTRPRHPWDSLGKNTGVGCHFLLQSMKVKSESEVIQSCPTFCDPMDCSLPGSSIHGIFQARVLEWVPLPSPITPYLIPIKRQGKKTVSSPFPVLSYLLCCSSPFAQHLQVTLAFLRFFFFLDTPNTCKSQCFCISYSFHLEFSSLRHFHGLVLLWNSA